MIVKNEKLRKFEMLKKLQKWHSPPPMNPVNPTLKLFEFLSVPRIMYGPGQFEKVGQIIVNDFKTKSVLIVSNSGLLQTLPQLNSFLDAVDVKYDTVLVDREPELEDVDRGIDAARKCNAGAVIGMGGGSAMDLAKAVAGLLTNGGCVLDYMEVIGKGHKFTKKSAPWLAIPTTAGTGAEVTKNAVVACKEKNFKASIRAQEIMATVALVDPALTVSLPAPITARTGMDAMTQCLEAFTSNNANIITDALAIEGFRLSATSLIDAVKQPSDLVARGNMMMSSLIGGITLANAGLGAVHGFAAPLGAISGIPHGSICGALLAAVVQYNTLHVPPHVTEKYKRLFEVVKSIYGEKFADLPAFLLHIARAIEIPGLSSFGFPESDVDRVCELAAKSSSMRYNPVKIPHEELVKILKNSM